MLYEQVSNIIDETRRIVRGKDYFLDELLKNIKINFSQENSGFELKELSDSLMDYLKNLDNIYNKKISENFNEIHFVLSSKAEEDIKSLAPIVIDDIVKNQNESIIENISNIQKEDSKASNFYEPVKILLSMPFSLTKKAFYNVLESEKAKVLYNILSFNIKLDNSENQLRNFTNSFLHYFTKED